MDFEDKLKMYAKLLIHHGVNVQEGQVVFISGEIIHRDLINLTVQEAYKRGAKYVGVDFIDYQLAPFRINLSRSEENLDYVPQFLPKKYEDMVDEKAATLRILGSEDPDSLSNLDPKKLNRMQINYRKSLKKFYDEGIGKSKIHWSIGAASTPKWAKKVFPNLSSEKAEAALWEEIFKICRADKPDCLELWKEHNQKLHDRARFLTNLQIEFLHFTGPNTDLKVGLSKLAQFKGGGDVGPYGQEFEPNIPTEECFTTPDFRKVSGKVQTTRPFLVNGKLVKNLYLEFTQGEISHYKASEGEESFKEYISNDPGAKRLGEVALVGIDSPVYRSGLIFEEILFDENAACHIAIGSAYRFCLEGGPKMTDEELKNIGCNDSNVHTDMMISSEEVDVIAKTYTSEEVPLIKKGKWVI